MLTPRPPRDEWLVNRQHTVGSSEIAALFGCQAAYALDAFALHHVKAGNAPAPDVGGPRVQWGIRLEEVIAAAVAEEHGYTVAPGRYATADDGAGMAASLDFEIEADVLGVFDGPGILETKSTDWMVHRRSWTDGEPPLHILLQLQHQLACTGWSWGIVAALVGGNDLRLYRYAARPALIEQIKAKVREFWRRVEAEEPPPPSGADSASAVLRALYAEPIDDALDLSFSNEFPEAAEAFIAAGAKKRDAEKDYDMARNRLEALLEGHKRAWGGGYSVSMSVTPEKPPRLPKPGEMIPGRKETRRLIAKVQELVA